MFSSRQEPRRISLSFLLVLAGLSGLAVARPASSGALPKPIAFFIYTPGLSGAERGADAVRAQFREFLDRLGPKSDYGSVGIALNYPYTTFVSGTVPANFAVSNVIKFYELNVRVAKEMEIPVLVGLNGGPWASVKGPFNSYWKMAEGGRYLARYQDGQVNQTLRGSGPIAAPELERFLNIGPYDLKQRQDALFLTLSPDAQAYRESRLHVLELALREWDRIDRAFPGAIQEFTTDSEVCDFSFRSDPSGDALPIGYEDFIAKPFCDRYGIANCAAYFRSHRFTYETEEDRRWFRFRADANKQFVADTVAGIRKFFPATPIFTHQLGTLDEKLLGAHNQDFASPQETAFVPGALPGVTAYIYGKREADFKKLVTEVSEKAAGRGWALAEFNPGKTWPGTRTELAAYTYETLRFLAGRQISMVGLLAWESNALDAGIKDTGIDDGVKLYLRRGPGK
jgi:hypothetical protein